MADPVRCRWLLHIDLDQFQVSVERRRRPELTGVEVIVGGDGDPSKARQVVTCASYEARARGVRAGMPLRAAYKKSPDVMYLPLDMELYEAASAEVWQAVRDAGPLVEVWGWDEGYVGLGAEGDDAPSQDEAAAFAETLRLEVRTRTGLDSCLGVSDNKQRAKAAAGFAKKAAREPGSTGADRVFVLTDANWYALMGERPARDLWSVGSRTAAELAAHGADTVNQLVAVDRDELGALFGPHQGDWLYVLARGGGDDTITVERPPAKSHSKSRTFERDLTEPAELHAAAAELAREVLAQVVDEGRQAVRVGVAVRTSTFFTRTKMRKLRAASTSFGDVSPVVDALLDAFQIDRPVRLLAVRLELD
ncbi:MAG: DNA polymerase IV [Gordonia sp. (in: high G+C Gram-positive bacteria)]